MLGTIGGYDLIDEIGSGSYGAVYRARDPLSGREVALKTLTKIADSDDLERFRREAWLAYEIGHPNIIDILHYGEDGGISFIVMELMPSSLRELVIDGRLSLSVSVRICYRAALGLRAAHERNVIHRDVKPDNILISSEGELKMTDFGLARAMDLTTLTAAGARVGTPLYMSPELWKGERADVRSGIYSLGVTLYEMLTGEAQLLIAGKTPVRQIRPSVPTVLERIVDKCTELDPRRRYQTMDELIRDVSVVELISRCFLIDFYEATGGPNWKRNDNWLTDASLDDWYGVRTNLDEVVTKIELSENDLQGEIPSEIGYLIGLKRLDLHGNRLFGRIPPEIAWLSNLEWLVLSGNRLSGNIPPDLCSLAKLQGLFLELER